VLRSFGREEKGEPTHRPSAHARREHAAQLLLVLGPAEADATDTVVDRVLLLGRALAALVLLRLLLAGGSSTDLGLRVLVHRRGGRGARRPQELLDELVVALAARGADPALVQRGRVRVVAARFGGVGRVVCWGGVELVELLSLLCHLEGHGAPGLGELELPRGRLGLRRR